MVFHCGTRRAQKAIMSVISRRCGSGREEPLLLGDVLLEDVVLQGAPHPVQSTPCSSAATRKKAKMTWAGPLMVIDTETSPSGIPSKRRTMSSALSTATPQSPTSPGARAWSESRPMRVGMSKATDTPCWPCSSRWRKRRLVSSTPANPANWRIVHGLPAVAGGVDAPGVGILPRVADVLRGGLAVAAGSPRRRDLLEGEGDEALTPLRRPPVGLLPIPRLTPPPRPEPSPRPRSWGRGPPPRRPR